MDESNDKQAGSRWQIHPWTVLFWALPCILLMLANRPGPLMDWIQTWSEPAVREPVRQALDEWIRSDIGREVRQVDGAVTDSLGQAQQALVAALLPLTPGGIQPAMLPVAPAGVTPVAAVPVASTLPRFERVLLVGDSLMQGVAPFLVRRLRDELGARVIDVSRQSTGLINRAYYNWPEKLRGFAQQHRPDAIVVMLGANDRGDIFSEGRVYRFGSEDWRRVYADRVRALIGVAAEQKTPLIWVGLPAMRKSDLDEVARINSQIYEAESKRAGMQFVPSRPLLSDDGERYSHYLKREGRPVLARAGDGIHLAPRGYDLVAEQVLQRLRGAARPATAGPPVVAPRVPVSGAPPATRESRLDFGATLKLGSSGARVERLRLRLTELGFAVERTGSFDAALDAQVKAFQIQAGLAPDGMVDQQTVFNLNLGEADKARLLAEREQGLREILARHAQGKVIIVNIPSFRLLAFSDARQVLDSRVVVGNPGRPTPLMRTDLYAVTFNPGWSPPPAVLNKDLFTQDQPNHKKMAKLGLKLVNAEGRAVDVSEIDSRQTFQQGGYRFFQPPGSNNALGKLKFELRNDQQIYLHDTNQRNLFQRQTRAYSSGCVRVERYEDLAAWVLDTSVDEIRAQTGQRGTRTRRVEVVPVYLVYWLADHEQNRVVYYTDLYRQKKG